MKTPLRIILALTIVLAGGQAASAQLRAEPPVTVTVTSPANGATVGRTVTFTGTAKPNIGLSVLIDDDVYIPDQDRGTTESREYAPTGTADRNGRFSFTINLDGEAVREAEGGASTAVTPGRHAFVVTELYADDAGQSAPITLTVDDNQRSDAAAETEGILAPTPTPTPSPTASLAPDVKGDFDFNELAKLLLAGALGGLAAYGFHRLYIRRKRR